MLLPHVDVACADGAVLLGVEPPGDHGELAHHDAVDDGVGVADVAHAYGSADGLLHGHAAAQALGALIKQVNLRRLDKLVSIPFILHRIRPLCSMYCKAAPFEARELSFGNN